MFWKLFTPSTYPKLDNRICYEMERKKIILIFGWLPIDQRFRHSPWMGFIYILLIYMKTVIYRPIHYPKYFLSLVLRYWLGGPYLTTDDRVSFLEKVVWVVIHLSCKPVLLVQFLYLSSTKVLLLGFLKQMPCSVSGLSAALPLQTTHFCTLSTEIPKYNTIFIP